MATLSRIAALILVLVPGSLAASCPKNRGTSRIPEGIHALHRMDVAATLSGQASALDQLWTEDAVLIQPGAPVEIGKAAIMIANKEAERSRSLGAAVTAYQPQICEVQVTGNQAVEWGYFRYVYHDRRDTRPQTISGKLLRVLRRGTDGSWRFSHVAWNSSV